MLALTIPKNARQIFIDGPQGVLDCIELIVDSPLTGVAIVFHPDPKGGGNNTNKVVQTIAKSLNSKGYLCICPNLRGVGQSSGVHDMGIGEVDDAYAVFEYVKENYPDQEIVLAGFSFGTSIAANLACRLSDNYRKLILLGPAVTRYSVPVNNNAKTIVIHGEDDEIIELSAVSQWSREQNQPIVVVPNTGHFFHGKLSIITQLLNSFII